MRWNVRRRFGAPLGLAALAGSLAGLVGVAVAPQPAGATPQVVSTVRASVATGGGGSLLPAAGAFSYSSSVSADGRWVAFSSSFNDLVPNDTNGQSDVFVRDLVGGTTTRVSVSATGLQANASFAVGDAVSADGRYVAFASNTALTANDTNGTWDVFVRDRDTDADGVFDEAGASTTRLLSRAASPGSPANLATGNGISSYASISSSGRFVAFVSYASDLVTADANGTVDVVVRDRDTDADGIYDEPGAESTRRVSVSSAGVEQNGMYMVAPRISDDGRHVLWVTTATTLDPIDTNTAPHVYLRDRDTDADGVFDEAGAVSTRVMSTSAAGALSDWESSSADLSPNGRFVAFATRGANITAGDTDLDDVFVRDRDPDLDGVYDEPGEVTVTRRSVSLSTDNSFATAPSVANTGAVAFRSGSNDFVTGDTNGADDVFLATASGPIVRVSVSSAGAQATLESPNAGGLSPIDPTLTPDGRVVVYPTASVGLDPSDTNNRWDVFATEVADPPLTLSTTLALSTSTTPPGARAVPIANIPTETIKGLGFDVSGGAGVPNLSPTKPGFKPTKPGFKPTKPGFKPTKPGFKPVDTATLTSFAGRLRQAPAARAVPVSQLKVTTAGGWPALFVGTPYAGRTSQSVSLGEVLDLLSGIPTTLPVNHPLRTLTLDDLRIAESPLSSISSAGFLLGSTPVQSLQYAGGQSWCARLSALTSGATTCTALGVTASTTLLELDLQSSAAEVLATYSTLRRPPLDLNRTLLVATGAPVIASGLNDLDLTITRLGDLPLDRVIGSTPAVAAIALSSLPTVVRDAVVECSLPAYDCATGTLGTARSGGVLRPGVTLAALGNGFGALTLTDLASSELSGIDLNDAVTGFLGKVDFPWEDLDLVTAGVQEYATAPATVHATVTVVTTGGAGPFSGTITADLPAGFRLVDGSEILTAAPGATLGVPTETYLAGSSKVVWSVSGIAADASTTLELDLYPGLRLGTGSVTATAKLGGATSTSNAASITVADDTDPGADEPGAAPIQSDTLYLHYLPVGSDTDVFSFTPAAGAQVGVRLSHLAGDADLVLYGPPADSAANGPSAVATAADGPDADPLPDVALDPNGAFGAGTADLGGDVPIIDGRTVAATSAATDAGDIEDAEAKEADLIQVSAYNGAATDLPYVLRVRERFPDTIGACSPYARSGGTVGTMPDLTTLPAGLRTLILVNEQRLRDTFPGGDVTTLLAKLQALAALPGVDGAVIPVDAATGAGGLPDIAGAYTAWNADPCDTDAANLVVRRIGELVQGIRTGSLPGVAAHPQLEYLVIGGSDDMIPMARLDDTTSVANETMFADEFDVSNQYYGTFATSHFLSDDPYADLDPVAWLNRRLYVPELSVGRLVETPTEMSTMVDQYTASSGLLGADRALVTGYDFMTPSAQRMSSTLTQSLTTAGGSAPTLTSRLSPPSTWTSAQVLADLGLGPDVAYLNGHASPTRAETPSTTIGGIDTYSATQVAAALPVGSRLVFSMGCHQGLSVSDAVVLGGPASTDFAQALGSVGAVSVAVTGYGYGDNSGRQLHDRLMLLFGRELDGAVSVGQALRNAKQQYFATQGLYGAYDDKVLASTVLYGLPMFGIGAGTTTRTAPTNTPTAPGTTGLHEAPFSFDPTFVQQTDPTDGSWFEVDLGGGVTDLPLAIAGRPIQPQTSADVTATQGGGSLRPAHGAVVRALTTDQVLTGFDAAWARATVDRAANEPEIVAGDLAFPNRLVTVTTASDPNGVPNGNGVRQRQRVVVVPGRYTTDAVEDPQGVGVQELFSHVSGTVYYSTSTDHTAPRISSVNAGVIATGQISIDVAASDAAGIAAVVAIWQDDTGTWRSADLTASGGHWVGGGVVSPTTTEAAYFVQVVDGAGNVSVSSNKGRLFAAAEVLGASIDDVTVTEPGTGSTEATFTVTLSAPATDPITIEYATVADSASAGTDFTATAGVLTFATGESTKTVAVPVLADAAVESAEGFRVELSNPVGATLTDPSGFATIDDASIGVRIGDVVVPEGHAGALVPAKITVRLDRPAPSETFVKVRTIADPDTNVPGATAVSDYRAITTLKTVRFKAGQVSRAVPINIVGDSLAEGDEDLLVELSNPSAGLAIADAIGHLTIRDDDPAPGTITVSAGDVVIDEHDSGPNHKAFVTVILSQPAASEVTVRYVTTSGAALAGTDYRAVTTARTLRFKAGTYKKTIAIMVYGDQVAEGDEAITIDLFDPSVGLDIGSDGTITIRDDD